MLNGLFFTTLILYLLATVLCFVGSVSGKDALKRACWPALLAAACTHTAYFIARGVVARRLPLANQFEFASAFAWGVAVMGLVLHLRVSGTRGWIIPLCTPAAFLILSYAALQPREVTELMPALKSAWFGLHIGTAVLSYAAFALAALAGGRYLLLARGAGDDKPLRELERLSYKLICFGFLMLSVVILSGCIWAEQAWGTFWSWDPKETWALITWLIYAVYLHQRLRAGWRGKRMAWLSIGAFVLVLFTFVGVNTLLSGLHSYA